MTRARRIDHVAISRGRPDRWRRGLGALVLAVPVIWAVLKGFPTHAPLPPEGGYFLNDPQRVYPWYSIASTWLTWSWLASIAGFLFTHLMPIWRRNATLTADDDALTFELEDGSRQTIARRDVLHLHRDAQGPLELRLAGGEVVRIWGSGGDGGVLGALPETWRQGPARVPIRNAAIVEPSGCVAATVWLAFGVAFVAGLGALSSLVEGLLAGELGRGLGWGVLAVACAGGLLRLLSRRELVIGTDGVRVVGALRDRFVPFADIEHVDVLPTPPFQRVRLRLRGGKRMHVPVIGDPHAVARRVADALTAWQTAGAAPEIELLERGDRTAHEWARALCARAEDASYREAGVRIEDLEAIVDDPRAPPERRVGAGLALAGDDRGRARVRIAASACADADLQAALEAAAEGEVAEPEIRRATRRHTG